MEKSTVIKTISEAIETVSDFPVSEINPQTSIIEDIGLDSLDFLDAVFEIEKRLGVSIPFDSWVKSVNDGQESPERYFVIDNLADRILELKQEQQQA